MMDNGLTTDNEVCRIIVEVLKSQGVKYAVISPGSRNAPLIVAFAREKSIKKWVVVDERSAAFVAVGIAQQTKLPVAIICTSGSAVLNYSPAIAEAFYQHLPIIVISADRTIEWIDQNDSQTIVQNGILSKIVKKTFDVPASISCGEDRWYANRMINEAVLTATKLPQAPVHINVQLREPLCGVAECPKQNERIVHRLETKVSVSAESVRPFADALCSGKKVMVVAGMGDYSQRLETILERLSLFPNFLVLTETVSNLRNEKFIPTIDRTLQAVPYNHRDEYSPDLLITFGGALVSRMLKMFLRKFPASTQLRIGAEINLIDTMQHLTDVVCAEPEDFFAGLLESVDGKTSQSDYATKWKEAERLAAERHETYLDNIGWCDLKAFSRILPSIPNYYNLQLSNGTSIRYAQLFDNRNERKCYCNRGVSGIDGSTSTALGASLEGMPTVLITGDMSLTYDLAGLASQYNSANFKVIVINNGGGGIFRFIKGPSDLPELEQYFEVRRETPFEKLATAFGWDCSVAENESQLLEKLPMFWQNEKPSLLVVKTPTEDNGKILRAYFKSLR